jgi:hypothetical protein
MTRNFTSYHQFETSSIKIFLDLICHFLTKSVQDDLFTEDKRVNLIFKLPTIIHSQVRNENMK